MQILHSFRGLFLNIAVIIIVIIFHGCNNSRDECAAIGVTAAKDLRLCKQEIEVLTLDGQIEVQTQEPCIIQQLINFQTNCHSLPSKIFKK